jgi:hypothetical protein
MEEFASDAQIQKFRRKPLTTATPFGFFGIYRPVGWCVLPGGDVPHQYRLGGSSWLFPNNRYVPNNRLSTDIIVTVNRH